ncbi:hypothetical protein K3495_g9368 [Podosphaera aphanis]|nr:hypothetical protein K3495_g9368 [Podosphaera aphanis]
MTQPISGIKTEMSIDTQPSIPGNGDYTSPDLLHDVWDSERLVKAMTALKQLHKEIRKLRTTIPRLIAPLTVQHPTPNTLLEEFSKSVDQANQEISQFQYMITSEENNKIIEYARAIRRKKGTKIKPWKVIYNPTWLTDEI